MHATQHLFYIVSQALRPHARDCRLLPYVLPRGTVLVVRKGMSFAEDNHNAPNVPDIATTLEGEEFAISCTMLEDKAKWDDFIYGPFSHEEYQKGIWHIEKIGDPDVRLRKAGSGVVLTGDVAMVFISMFRDFLRHAADEPDAQPVTCFRPVFGDTTDGPHRIEKYERVPEMCLLESAVAP